jgi:Formate/nitrite transporter
MEKGQPEPGTPQSPQVVTFDAILPATMAARAEESGVKRISTDLATLLVLSVLAGAFIAFGAVFATTVGAGTIPITATDGAATYSAALPYGVVRLLTGVAFSLGLILVVVGGAELFTGNNLIVMAWASGKVRTRDLLFNWVVAFVGNSVGAFTAAVLMFCTTQYSFGGGAVGLVALTTASAKTSLEFVGRRARRHVQCTRMLGGMDVLQRPHYRRPRGHHHSAHHCLCGCRIRAQHRECLFHPNGTVHQARRSGNILDVYREDGE